MRVSVLLIVLLVFGCSKKNEYQKAANSANIPAAGDYTIQIISGPENTYGYDILKAGKVFIHQPHIPGIRGVKGFPSEEQANAVAILVVYKLKNNIMPPTITPRELDSLQTLN